MLLVSFLATQEIEAAHAEVDCIFQSREHELRARAGGSKRGIKPLEIAIQSLPADQRVNDGGGVVPYPQAIQMQNSPGEQLGSTGFVKLSNLSVAQDPGFSCARPARGVQPKEIVQKLGQGLGSSNFNPAAACALQS